MQWGPDVDAKLFMHVLKIHQVKLDYKALAVAMGPDCTAKAITHRIAKLKSMGQECDAALPPGDLDISPPKPAKRGRTKNPTTGDAKSSKTKSAATGSSKTSMGRNRTATGKAKEGMNGGGASSKDGVEEGHEEEEGDEDDEVEDTVMRNKKIKVEQLDVSGQSANGTEGL